MTCPHPPFRYIFVFNASTAYTSRVHNLYLQSGFQTRIFHHFYQTHIMDHHCLLHKAPKSEEYIFSVNHKPLTLKANKGLVPYSLRLSNQIAVNLRNPIFELAQNRGHIFWVLEGALYSVRKQKTENFWRCPVTKPYNLSKKLFMGIFSEI